MCVCTTGFLNAGSGTETVLYEAAAYGLVGVVSGGDLWETAVAHNKYCNYATPLEARLACEVGHTAARQEMTRAQANEIALELLEKLLDLEGIRTLVALGWVVAGFLYELGVTLEWEEVQLLARLGGWVPRKDRKPGKITLVRGLRRPMDTIATRSFLDLYAAEHGHLPPRIAAMLGHAPPGEL